MLVGYFLQVGYRLHASRVCLHSNYFLEIFILMSKVSNEQKMDFSEGFPGWQHIRQGKSGLLNPRWLLLASLRPLARG